MVVCKWGINWSNYLKILRSSFLDNCYGIVCSSGIQENGECYENDGTCVDGTCTYNMLAAGTSCSIGSCNESGTQNPFFIFFSRYNM